ncbi:coiled-coil domain-containing protein 181 isoform X2 [Boleophthalmus pectinirostris]|uniref:coiled-coil domain-containing protein 181 isoform X2 n=1 Tax=Boleophthalmus pectinirostris TaxID=150288 RepID=UPI00242CC73A|nr:coiled-coil domain-containing protein 181 isoform X2 [Boleophthalmus pectinirostris]
MNEVVCTKSQEDYEDDFEKDLDWLISEEGRSEYQGPNYDDIEAEIDKELEEEHTHTVKHKDMKQREERRDNKILELDDEERWPSPMDPLEYDSDRDSPSKSSDLVPPPPEIDEQTEEEKKYILEKIQQANRELQDQEAPDMTRRRRLHFKETLVDLVVPPMQFEKDTGKNEDLKGNNMSNNDTKDTQAESEVSGKLSELKLSPREDRLSNADLRMTGDSNEGGMEGKEGRVLIEKDGKFDLVSIKDVESQGLLPPILSSDSTHSLSSISSKKHSASFSPRSFASHSSSKKEDKMCTPKPPSQPRVRPSSASHGLRTSQGRGTKRRVQSATGMSSQTTFMLSPQQKEMLLKIQEKKERLAREAEEKKREEEEQKRQENELAFKAWLMRKREQIVEEKRVQRAQEMERMNCKKDTIDPEEAFRHWLQRKQEQQQKEKQLVELRRLEEDTSYLLHSREDCEHAFRRWLRRKRLERQAEQQAARERSRRLVLEERQARRMKDLMCTVSDAKPFRFNEQLSYHF